MYCAKCGQKNAEEARFCSSCGAALQVKEQSATVATRHADKRILGLVGLMAGVLTLVGLFGPWVTVSGWGLSGGVSAWDLISNADLARDLFDLRELFEMGGWGFLALAGAVFLVVGALSVLAAPRIRVLWAILPLGGILALVGAVWAFSDINTGSILGFTASYGYGLYLTLGGGILGLSGVLGLVGWPSHSGR